MHKKRTYRRRARTGSDSEEEAGIVTTEQSGIPKPIGLSFDDTLESDIPFVPRAPRARSSQNSSILHIPAETDDQQQSQAVTLEGADSRLSVTLVESKGYSVFASTPMAAGQTLIREAPYGAVIEDEHIRKYCSACFSGSEQPLSRCSSCKLLYYCSRQCQTSDWKAYHSIECPSFTKIGKSVPTAIRCLTRIIIQRANDPESFKTVEKLSIGKESVPEKVKLKYAQLIMAVRQILPAKMLPSASDTMDLICRFTVNSMAVLGFDYAGIGVGLYTNVCRLNHSCWPNCILTFEGKTAVLRTIRDVNSSEELCICYIDIMEPYETRQERLLAQYYFKCQCELCSITKDIDMRNALRCQRESCIGAVRYPDNLESAEMYVGSCSTCSTELSMPLADIQERQDRIHNLLNLASSLIKNDKPRARLNLENCVRIGDGFLHMCHHLLVKARQQLKEIAIDLQDWDMAYSVTKQLFDLYQMIYPPNSPITAIESFVIAKMYSNLKPEYSWSLHAHYIQALKLLEICYEPQSSIIRAVKKEIRALEAEQSFRQHQIHDQDV